MLTEKFQSDYCWYGLKKYFAVVRTRVWVEGDKSYM